MKMWTKAFFLNFSFSPVYFKQKNLETASAGVMIGSHKILFVIYNCFKLKNNGSIPQSRIKAKR